MFPVLYLVLAAVFWALFVTIGAEQFGTNLRATTATTVPNMVRGFLAILVIPLFSINPQPQQLYNRRLDYRRCFLFYLALFPFILPKKRLGKIWDYLEE